ANAPPQPLAQLRDEVSEEEEQKRRSCEGQLLALQVACAARSHARYQRHTQSHSTQKTTNVSVVVDADDARKIGPDPDDQIQHGELNHGTAQPMEFKRRYRQPLVRE